MLVTFRQQLLLFLELNFALREMLLRRAVSWHRHGLAVRPFISIYDTSTFLLDFDGLLDPPCCPVRLRNVGLCSIVMVFSILYLVTTVTYLLR